MNRLVVAVPAGAADAIANRLAECGAVGIEVRDQDTLVSAPPGQTELVVYLPAGEVAQRVAELGRYVQSLRSSGWAVDPWSCRSEDVDEHEWRDRWREFFLPSRVGRRFVVCPSWRAVPATGDDLVLLIDPGQAFGTGAHPSTRLCLRAMERVARIASPPRAVLDVGSGSGILAAAAALIFGEECAVTGIDIDPVAVESAGRTLRQNALSSRVQLRCEPLEVARGAFDLVLANLQADVLSAHRERLSGLVQGAGRLVLSGLLVAEAGVIAQDFCAAGELHTEYTEDEGEWRVVSLRRI